MTLWVTDDFSKNCLLAKEVAYANQSAMQILQQACNVKAAFGGAFVTSIDGIRPGQAGEKKNWFYYVNGIMANVGARQYNPKPGDNIWWDFHSWDGTVYISSVIGAYPQPFLSGYGGRTEKTFILHTLSLKSKALGLKEKLEELGVQNVGLKAYDERLIREQNNIFIIIGSWQDLKQHKAIGDIYKNYRKTGLFIKIEGDKLHVMDIYGKTQKELEKAAAIVATKGGVGLSGTIWFITGTDDESIETALDILINEPGKIKFYSGAVVTSEEILNVPLSKKYQTSH